jgi:hypothetical protein
MRYSFVLLLLWCFPSVFLFAQDPLRLAKISDPQLQEISGIIPSTYHEGMFWLHNDSGDKAQIYLIDSLGKLRHICYLEAGCHYFKLNASILQAQKDIGHFAKAIWVII